MTLALRKIRVIDGFGGATEKATLLIRDGRIAAFGNEGQVSIPRGATSIDGRGLTVLPGLIDCHVHLGLGGDADVVRTIQAEPPGLTLLKATRFARLTLEAGFTTVRDVGYRDHSIFSLKQGIQAGLLPGPRIRGGCRH